MIDTRSDQDRAANTARPSRTRTKAQQRWYEKYRHLLDDDLLTPAVMKAAGLEKTE